MLKIVNEASYPFSYDLLVAVTSSPLFTNQVLFPNQIAAFQFDSVPGDKQNAIYCTMNTYLYDQNTQTRGSMIEQEINLPANATVTIATRIQTGYLSK